MSIDYEWATVDDASPAIVGGGRLPDGEYIADEDRELYADEMIDHDKSALVLGAGRPLVIEGTPDELVALLLRSLELVERHRGTDTTEPEGDAIVKDVSGNLWWRAGHGWSNADSRLEHDWDDIPRPIARVYYAPASGVNR